MLPERHIFFWPKVYFYLETEQGINKEFRKQVFFNTNQNMKKYQRYIDAQGD